ncbi:MAG: zinc-ribbon domain-containing protein, partial [Terriglobales bacterium]
GEITVICPNCGENNSANFRYCGMCGTSLEMRRPAGAPRTVSSDPLRAQQYEDAQNDANRTAAQTTVRANTNAVRESTASASPSFLGLNQPFTDGHGNDSTNGGSANESFSGLDSFFEPEDSGVSARGVVLLLVLLAVLGAGGWWAYLHYNGVKPAGNGNDSPTAAQTPAPPPSSSGTDANSPAGNTNPAAASSSSIASTSSPNAGSPANSAPSQPPAAPVESARSTPPPKVEPQAEPKAESNKAESKSESNVGQNPPAARKPARENARPQKIARAEAKPSPRLSAAVVPASGDKGDAEYKRGEAYLYGRGMPENCAEAIKNLKDASAMQNAKARSMFGTMYATGHCVPRDLPTSYSWFAQALRVDPNNQILEKDLTAVWNQMTPPERQIVARNKQ